MPQPIIATDMLGAIARSKAGSGQNKPDRCKSCDSTNVYEKEESEGKMIVTYRICEDCKKKEKVNEKKKSLLGQLFEK